MRRDEKEFRGGKVAGKYQGAQTGIFPAAVDLLSALNNLRLQVSATSAVVPTTLAISADGRTITLTPEEPLAPNTAFRIVYDSGFRTSNAESLSPGTGECRTVPFLLLSA